MCKVLRALGTNLGFHSKGNLNVKVMQVKWLVNALHKLHLTSNLASKYSPAIFAAILLSQCNNHSIIKCNRCIAEHLAPTCEQYRPRRYTELRDINGNFATTHCQIK